MTCLCNIQRLSMYRARTPRNNTHVFARCVRRRHRVRIRIEVHAERARPLAGVAKARLRRLGLFERAHFRHVRIVCAPPLGYPAHARRTVWVGGVVSIVFVLRSKKVLSDELAFDPYIGCTHRVAPGPCVDRLAGVLPLTHGTPQPHVAPLQVLEHRAPRIQPDHSHDPPHSVHRIVRAFALIQLAYMERNARDEVVVAALADLSLELHIAIQGLRRAHTQVVFEVFLCGDSSGAEAVVAAGTAVLKDCRVSHGVDGREARDVRTEREGRDREREWVHVGGNIAEVWDEVCRKFLSAVRVPFLRQCGDDGCEVVSGDRFGRGQVHNRTALVGEREVDVLGTTVHARGAREGHIVPRDGLLESPEARTEQRPVVFVSAFLSCILQEPIEHDQNFLPFCDVLCSSARS